MVFHPQNALSYQKQTELPSGGYYETNVDFHGKDAGHGDTKAHMTGVWYDKAPKQGGEPISDPQGHDQWHTYLAPGSSWQHGRGPDFRAPDYGDPMPQGGMKKKVETPVEEPTPPEQKAKPKAKPKSKAKSREKSKKG